MSRLYAGIYTLFLVLFGLLSYFAHKFPFFPGDIATSLWLQGVDLPFLNPVMKGISYISSFTPAFVIVALVTIGLWASRRKLEPIFLASLTGSQALLNWLLKLLVSRPRPTSELVEVLGNGSGFSFPSGHTTYAVVFYGCLFYLTPRVVKQPVAARALRAFLALLILLTGTSRIYLGVHWFSDTLGSLLLGGLLLAPAIALFHNYARRQKPGDKNA